MNKEETNEMSLTELINETLQKTTFDYGDVTPEDRDTLVRIKLRKGVIIHNTIVEIGGDLKVAQKIYSKKGNGKFTKWVEEEYGMSYVMAKKYISAYDVLVQNGSEKLLNPGLTTILQQLGVHKLSSLAKLPIEQQKQVIENAPLEDMNKRQVEELTKAVKEAEEYSDELIEEIRKKDKKINDSIELQEMKDKEIESLKAKVQELESKKEQSIEPKVVEVEKIIEKEVIPDYIQNELDRLREEVADKDDRLKSAKETMEAIVTQQNSKFGTQEIDWGSLATVVNHFLKSAGEFTYLKEAFKETSGQGKSYVKTQVERIEKWVIEMKKMMNTDLAIGNTIYDNVDFEVENV